MNRACKTVRYRMTVALFGLWACACATHVPEPKPHPDTPHISWAIAEGYIDKEVCRSTENTTCTLNLSTQSPERRIGVFHVFLHPASVDTKYAGSVDVGFLVQSDTKHTHAIDQVVVRGSAPVNFSVAASVKPAGTYFVNVNLTATAADGTGSPVPITVRIRVDVK